MPDEQLRAVGSGRYIRPSLVVEASWVERGIDWFLRLTTVTGTVYCVECRAEQDGWIEALGIPDVRVFRV